MVYITLTEDKIYPWGFDYSIDKGILTIDKVFYTKNEAVYYAGLVFDYILRNCSDCVVFYYFYAFNENAYMLVKTVGCLNYNNYATQQTCVETQANQRY